MSIQYSWLKNAFKNCGNRKTEHSRFIAMEINRDVKRIFFWLTTCSWCSSYPMKMSLVTYTEVGKLLSAHCRERSRRSDNAHHLHGRESATDWTWLRFSLEPGGGCVDRSWTTSLRPSDTKGAANFAFVLSSHYARLRISLNFWLINPHDILKSPSK